jgi:(R,R)-butanediol dehydrogenase/meso-butanediol dehydrogenase/diacetyl reductase
VKAIVFRRVGEPLDLVTIDDPTPGEMEVVLQVGRCGICGSDLHVTEDNLLTFKEGTVLGHEFSGEVVAMGKGVTHLKLGDRVTALPWLGCNRCRYCLGGLPNFCDRARMVGSYAHTGGYAEFVATGSLFTIKLPEGLSLEDGALIEPLAVGLHAVIRGKVRPGDKVLVLGAGPVGLAVAYWAKKVGAGKIGIQASSDRRAAIARVMGVDTFIFPDANATPTQSSTDALGGLPDVVFECVGAPGLIDQAVAAVRNRGVVVVLGLCATMDRWFPAAGLLKEVDVRFSICYRAKDFRVALDALESGDVSPRSMITGTVDLPHMAAVFEDLRHRSQHCKVMVNPSGL